jgi:hypothetical protein
MTNKRFLRGIPAFLLAFALIFTACETSTLEVEGTVGISGQEAPAVTAAVVKGGVLLEWNPIMDANYTVWRKESAGGADAIQLADYISSNSQDPKTGKFRYVDLVGDDNELKPNIEYTYTVTASGTSKTTARGEARATPADIPAKGAKLAPVSGVTLVLDQDAEKATVSWTEPAGAVPSRYSISVYRDGSSVNSTSVSFGETSATLNWTSYNQTDGEYAAYVQAVDLYSSGGSSYFKESDFAVSAGQKFEALFGGGGGPYASIQSPITDTNSNITGFAAYISFGGAKPGVTYTVDRAPADAAGNAGTYAAVSVYKNTADTTALTAADLTADVLGNLPNSTVYDKSLPAAAGKYKYRIKAVKGTVTQTKEIHSAVTVDPRSYAGSLSISLGAATAGAGTPPPQTYAVTPGLAYKGALQAGDRLVIYYVKGSSSNLYETGPYIQGIEFSKAELEAAAVVAKDLVIPKTDGDSYAYAQAYIVFADGRAPRNLSSASGGGVSSTGSYQANGGYDNIYYAALDY